MTATTLQPTDAKADIRLFYPRLELQKLPVATNRENWQFVRDAVAVPLTATDDELIAFRGTHDARPEDAAAWLDRFHAFFLTTPDMTDESRMLLYLTSFALTPAQAGLWRLARFAVARIQGAATEPEMRFLAKHYDKASQVLAWLDAFATAYFDDTLSDLLILTDPT